MINEAYGQGFDDREIWRVNIPDICVQLQRTSG